MSARAAPPVVWAEKIMPGLVGTGTRFRSAVRTAALIAPERLWASLKRHLEAGPAEAR